VDATAWRLLVQINGIDAIDTVVNIWTEESLTYRPSWRHGFYQKMRADPDRMQPVSLERQLDMMDQAGIKRGFLVCIKAGRLGHPSTYHLPMKLVADAIQKYPDRFCGLMSVDPTQGMMGVRELEVAVKEYGFIGAHSYPHWFELAPDHARYYPFYAKCCELDVPMMLHIGQSMIYAPDYPCRSVAQPITLDGVACDLPELKIVASHIGIPWTQEMIAMCWKHPNIYIASDAHSPKYWPENFVHYINTYGQDKVMFGTDFPVLDFSRTMKEIRELNLRENVLPKFLRDNAARVYKLKI
jgi:predicted TIM-barrel fold metal-dependent hydrolase